MTAVINDPADFRLRLFDARRSHSHKMTRGKARLVISDIDACLNTDDFTSLDRLALEQARASLIPWLNK
jgi:hypothetical protein